MAANQSITLSNGMQMPSFGLGTWLSQPGEVKAAVGHAIDAGYKHIDCAFIYQNEGEVGEALQEKFAAGAVARADLFITSKLWNGDHHSVQEGCEKTLKSLKLDYLDLYLIHTPCAFKPGSLIGDRDKPWDEKYAQSDLVATWKQMEKLVIAGKVKSIGISNFNISQTQLILDNCTIRPVMQQIESHPYFPNQGLIDFCKKNHIAITAYSPLGNPGFKKDSNLLENPVVNAIAKKHGREPAQILINYQLSRGNVCIPKSVTKSRIVSNYEATKFTLTAEEVAQLDSLNKNERVCTFEFVRSHKSFPFV